MFSKACEYGIKAVIYIATQSLENQRVKIGDVATHTGSPEAFTGKIMSTLPRHQLVNSQTGPYGGFYMAPEKIKQTKVSDIVFAIDGDSVFNGCALGLDECDHHRPCPMHHQFITVRNSLKHLLETTSIYDLAMGLKAGESVLIR